MRAFPFGRPVTPARLSATAAVCSCSAAYPSALHVRWQAPDGIHIAALAVDNEPVPFWTGADQAERVEAWSARSSFRPEWGSVEPAGPANGSSGRWVDDQVLAPLGFTRAGGVDHRLPRHLPGERSAGQGDRRSVRAVRRSRLARAVGSAEAPE